MPLPSRAGFPEQVPGVEPTRPAVGLTGERALPVRRGGRCRGPRPVDLEGMPVLSGRSARQDGVPTADPRPVDSEGVPVLSGRSARQDGVPAVRRSSQVPVDGPLLLTPRHGSCRTRLRRRHLKGFGPDPPGPQPGAAAGTRRKPSRRCQTGKNSDVVTSAVCAVSTRTWQFGTAESRCRWAQPVTCEMSWSVIFHPLISSWMPDSRRTVG